MPEAPLLEPLVGAAPPPRLALVVVLAPLARPTSASVGAPLVVFVRAEEVAIAYGAAPEDAIFVGLVDGRHCWAVDASAASGAAEVAAGSPAGTAGPGALSPEGLPVTSRERAPEHHPGQRARSASRDRGPYGGLRELWGAVDEPTWSAAGRAFQLVVWARTHRFCGRCGAPTELLEDAHARRCPRCELSAFPRVSPAVITLVERGDGTVLLARNARARTGVYSCIAGFVEAGETLEDAVRREVLEEVGVETEDIRYRGSQPWPFPHSLMVGFRARWASGEPHPDGREIADARWFSAEQLPALPAPMSIARRLIEEWAAAPGPD